MFGQVTRRGGVALLLLGAAAGIAVWFWPVELESRLYDEPSSDMLLVRGRDHVALCIDVAGGASVNPGDATKRLRNALDAATRHPNWSLHGYPAANASVDSGCPSEPYLLRPGVKHIDGYIVEFVPGLDVELASKYLVFVFVLPPDLIQGIFHGNESFWGGRILYQETFIRELTSTPVSYGLYISTDELVDLSLLQKWVNRSLLLERDYAG